MIVGALVASGLHGHAGALHPPQPQSATAPAAILSEGATIQRQRSRATPIATRRCWRREIFEMSVSEDQFW